MVKIKGGNQMPIRIRINKTKVPVFIWTHDVESGAIDQAVAMADRLPLASHVACMADLQHGYGMPVGGVMAMKDAISPMAVGSDQGCGMLAMKLNITEIPIEQQREIYKNIRFHIPVGFNSRDPQTDYMPDWEGFRNIPDCQFPIQEMMPKIHSQLGTLGGGNHFIEFQQGTDGHIWVMLHSGSRRLGHDVAKFYHRLAKEHGHNELPDLSYFDIDSPLGQEFDEVLKYTLAYAQANRESMAAIIMLQVSEVLKISGAPLQVINVHHNYATEESHFGKKVMVHRKGATSAREGELGIIPGSQGTKSYIVKGKGCVDSFMSCSHGAGRTMSRTAARRMLSVEQVKKGKHTWGEKAVASMGELEFDKECADLSECPLAYKDIEEVMDNQTDLVDIVETLTPYQLAAIKG